MMTDVDAEAEIERLCDVVVASIRRQLIKNHAPFLTARRGLMTLRADPELRKSIRAALLTGDPKFPHCDEIRERLGWDVWQ